MRPDPASASACFALRDDPFYRSISVDFDDEDRRQSALTAYFTLSINEGKQLGRCVYADNPALGVAVWQLPQTLQIETDAAERKRAGLMRILGPLGFDNYCRIIEYMSDRASRVVEEGSWYLSIVAVDPAQQGRGLGRVLLAPTLTEADAHGVACFLETFSPRNPSFYRRLGFHERARFTEPTTGSDYIIMTRTPGGPHGDNAGNKESTKSTVVSVRYLPVLRH
jgi:GNAT superfamily N-acetyltransferase